MTVDQTTAQTLVQDPGSPAEPQTEAPEGNDTEEAHKGNREARYRVERNEARDALATATARIEAMQTREVEQLASASLSNPADLLALGGVTLADLLDDNGDVDPAKVQAVANDVLASRPGLRPAAAATDKSQGIGASPERSPSWIALFTP
jgi:hypothetical protein